MADNKPKWVRWKARDMMDDTVNLSPTEELAYLRLTQFVLLTNDNLLADDKALAAHSRAGRKWGEVKAKLLSLGLIRIEDNFLRIPRAQKMCSESASYIAQKRDAANARFHGSKPLENNETVDADAYADAMRKPCGEDTDASLINNYSKSREITALSLLPDCPPVARAKPTNAEPDGFAEWYQAYPRHEGRAAAARAYPAAVRKVGSPARLLALLQQHRFNPERRYIPHPATWLNGERWKDDPLPDETPPQAQASATVVPMTRPKNPAGMLAAFRNSRRTAP